MPKWWTPQNTRETEIEKINSLQWLKVNLEEDLFVLSPPQLLGKGRCMLEPIVNFDVVLYCGSVFIWLWPQFSWGNANSSLKSPHKYSELHCWNKCFRKEEEKYQSCRIDEKEILKILSAWKPCVSKCFSLLLQRNNLARIT